MAGNSVRSDILPMLEAGGYAALIPYPLVWEHERAEKPSDHPRFREMETLAHFVYKGYNTSSQQLVTNIGNILRCLTKPG